MKNTKKQRGISLIVLVITIIVMIILAASIILSLSNSGIIGKSNEAKFKNDVKSMQEELEVLNANSLLEGSNTGITINDITSAKNYKDKFIVQDGELKYIKSKLTEEEIAWAKGLNLKSNAVKLVHGQNGVTIEDGTIKVTDSSQFNLTDVEIPSGVTEISAPGFSGSTSLVSVEIPSGVTIIGSAAFSGCTSLVSVEIPDTVTNIGSAFVGCTSLKSITIPNSVTGMGVAPFNNCTSLESVTLSSSMTSLSDRIFFWLYIT